MKAFKERAREVKEEVQARFRRAQPLSEDEGFWEVCGTDPDSCVIKNRKAEIEPSYFLK